MLTMPLSSMTAKRQGKGRQVSHWRDNGTDSGQHCMTAGVNKGRTDWNPLLKVSKQTAAAFHLAPSSFIKSC